MKVISTIPQYWGQYLIFFKQIGLLTRANLRSRYRKTLIGMLWVIANPLIVFGVQSLVFMKILQLNIPNYALFLASGLLPWIFITQSLEMGTPIFVISGRLLKSFPVHPLIYLIAQIIDNLINFMIAFLIVLTSYAVIHPSFISNIIILPVILIPLVISVIGLTWLLATIQVFFRDTRYIVNFGLSICFFLTPIFYPIHFVPEKIQWFIHINPFYRLIDPFQVVLYGQKNAGIFQSLLLAYLIAGLFISTAYFVWEKNKNEIYFKL